MYSFFYCLLAFLLSFLLVLFFWYTCSTDEECCVCNSEMSKFTSFESCSCRIVYAIKKKKKTSMSTKGSEQCHLSHHHERAIHMNKSIEIFLKKKKYN